MDDKFPLVSVIMAAYNHEQYVEEAVMSVINQTYPNIELIVVDDGSSDQTFNILKALSSQYGFQLYTQSNQGLNKTLNRLKLLAKGKYISGLASDDFYHPNMIATLISYLEASPQFAIVYSKIVLVDQNSNISSYINEPYQYGNIFKNLLSADFFINGVGVLMRKNIYDQFSYTDGYIDDYPMWLQIAQKHEIGFVNEYLSYYRIHNNHLSSNLLKMQEAERKAIDLYKNEPSYPYALCKWNLRWLNNTSRCYKRMALKHYLIPALCRHNLMDIKLFKALIKFLIPCNKKLTS